MFRDGIPRTLWPWLAIVLAAGAFWGAAWHDMDDSVLSRSPILDEAHYLRKAHDLAHDAWIPDSPYYMSPLYSYLVAATGSGRTFDEHALREGPSPWGIRLLQAVLWLGTAALLHRIGRRWFGPRWGWLPPLLWLGYRPAAILAGQVLLEIPLAFTATAALAVAGRLFGPRDAAWRAILAGLLVGAAALLRGTSLLMIVPVLWLLFRENEHVPRGRLWAAAVLAAILVLLPAAIHNTRLAGRPTGPSMNGGVNLYIGNWSGANGFFHSFDGFDVEADLGGAEYLSGKLDVPIRGLAEADRAWSQEALSVMTDDPLRVAGLWAKKVWLHVVGAEIPQISPPGAWPQAVPVYRFLMVPYGLLSALALVGFVLGWRSRPELRPWLAMVVLLVGFQSLFFVVSRYRLILVPALTLAATAGVVEMVSRRGRSLVMAVGLIIVAGLAVVPWGLGPTLDMFETSGLDNVAVRWQHVGMAAAAAGDQDEAERAFAEGEALFRRSVDRDPHRAPAWRGLARLLWLDGDREGAIEVAREGLGSSRRPALLRDDLIGMLLEQRRGDEAVPHIEAALNERPDDADLLHNAAVALAGTGRTADAVRAAQRLIVIAPDDPRGYLDLGVVLGRVGRLIEAREAFATGLERVPGHAALRANLEHTDSLIGPVRE